MYNANEELIEELAESLDEEALKLDGLNNAIIGVSSEGYLVYCYDKIVQIFVERDGMDHDEAVEFADFNVLGIGGGNWVISMPISHFLLA